MKNKLIDELEKTIEFLHQTGWHKQAVWYENKLKLIKESEEGCASFYQNLHEVDASLTGMGSFSDLPVKQEFVDQQWDLVERIHQFRIDCHMHSISAHYISVHQKFINKQQPC